MQLSEMQGAGKIKAKELSQPPFTCSKLTIETLEQAMKYVQGEQ